MTMRQTPFFRLRYPWTSDVVNAADLQAMGSDIDQALVQTATLANNFSRFASVIVKRSAAQSVAKSSLVTISFDTVTSDNGAESAFANGAWYNAATPTRVTAPSACVVLASTVAGLNMTGTWGSPACWQIGVALNGSATAAGIQGTKYSPPSTMSGQTPASALSMWKLAAGDYLELKVFWTGTPAGPFNTDTTFAPQLSLMVVSLPSVP